MNEKYVLTPTIAKKKPQKTGYSKETTQVKNQFDDRIYLNLMDIVF